MKKNFFKTLTLVLAVPAMLLTASCSKDEDPETPTVKSTTNKTTVTVDAEYSYIYPVTRASFNESSYRTQPSEGDQLLIYGYHSVAGDFSGMLTFTTYKTFSGEVTTENEYTGSGQDLISGMSWVILYPSGYEEYGFMSTEGSGANVNCVCNYDKAFVSGDLKLGVSQLSNQYGSQSWNGYAMSARSAVLAITVTGLGANTTYNIKVTGGKSTPQGKVTTNATGEAQFCVGYQQDAETKRYKIVIDDGSVYGDIDLGSQSFVSSRFYEFNKEAVAK